MDLTYGNNGYLVSLLQYALQRAGLDAGNPDGIFGRRTAKALMRFQREQGLAADGIAENSPGQRCTPISQGTPSTGRGRRKRS